MIDSARTHVRSELPHAARRSGAAVAALSTLAAVGIAVLPGSAGSAQAVEVTPRPQSGSVVFEGRGYGHGRGMSQWGAYGAADAGLAWADILAFYYPGTALHKVAGGSIRVWISGDNDGSTTVLPAPGLTAIVGRTARALPTGAGYRAWRVEASGDATKVAYLDAAGAWKPYRLPVGKAVVFRSSSKIVTLSLPGGIQQALRGSVIAHRDGSSLKTVLDSTMESYLRSVVPNEMPSSWHVQALAAQSVAARTYAAAYLTRQRAKGAVWDICDTISCQVFKGVARVTKAGTRIGGETKRTDDAIARTAGLVLRSSKRANAPLAFTEFSASNGGYSVAGGPSYQVAKSDPYDGRMKNPNTGWTKQIPVRTLEQEFGLGQLTDVRIINRDGRGQLGGRVQDLQLRGTKRAVTISGTKMRQTLALRSDWFVVKAVPMLPTQPAGRTPASKR
ncbi:MAG: SpoIID/LytB domain-containing protein [Micrococcales bacterium]|nr:SpoIID/LytB domain-containing protein [Micrococcales bacterium]